VKPPLLNQLKKKVAVQRERKIKTTRKSIFPWQPPKMGGEVRGGATQFTKKSESLRHRVELGFSTSRKRVLRTGLPELPLRHEESHGPRVKKKNLRNRKNSSGGGKFVKKKNGRGVLYAASLKKGKWGLRGGGAKPSAGRWRVPRRGFEERGKRAKKKKGLGRKIRKGLRTSGLTPWQRPLNF